MNLRTIVAGTLLVGTFASPLVAQESKLNQKDMRSLALANMLVPSSNEIFSALEKNLPSVKWQGIPSYNTKKSYTNRAVVALNLGVRIADGFIAIQTKDKDKLLAMGETAKSLSENLGIKNLSPDVSDMFKKYAEQRNWRGLVNALDNFQSQYMSEMKRLGDSDLITLASIGGWWQGMYLVSNAIDQQYTEQASKLLYQPHLVAYFKARLDAMNAKNKNLPLVKSIMQKLDEVATLINVGNDKPVDKKSVAKIKEISSSISLEIQKG